MLNILNTENPKPLCDEYLKIRKIEDGENFIIEDEKKIN